MGSVNGEFLFSRVTIVRNIAIASYGGGMSFVSLNNDLTFVDCLFADNEAIAGGGVHAAMDNPRFSMTGTTISGNRVDLYGGGIYIGQEHRAVTLTDMTIINNRGDSGAGIFIDQFNSINIVNANISYNEAVKQGGGMFSSAHDMRIKACHIRGNKAETSAGAIFSYGDNHAIQDKVLVIYDCEVMDNRANSFGGIQVLFGSNMVLRGCIVNNNTADASDSGGVAIRESYNCSLTSSTFDSNNGYFGGALSVQDSSDISLKGLTFSQNSARKGGSVYFQNLISSHMSVMVFNNNSAAVDGGALWCLDCGLSIENNNFLYNYVAFGNGAAIYLSSSTLSMTNSMFKNNRANRGAGGAVFWEYHSNMNEPSGLRAGDNVFIDNSALYGVDWATEGVHVMILNSSIYVTDYTSVAPPVDVSIGDFYNATVRTESEAYVEVSSVGGSNCFDSTGFVTGDIIQRLRNGTATFASLLPQCAPGFYIDAVISANIPSTSALLRYYFRECEVGEFYGDRICQPCANGSYSFVDPNGKSLSEISDSVCMDCPSQASHCSRNTLILKPEYWRIADDSHRILDCPFGAESCVGGAMYGNSLCGEGYVDALCAVCDDGYVMYASTQTCEECDSSKFGRNPFALILILAIVVVVVFLCLSKKQMGVIKTFDQFLHFNMLKIQLKSPDETPDTEKEILQIRTMRLSFQTRLTIYLSFFQILAVLPYVLDLKLPDNFSTMLYDASSVLNLSPTQAALMSCNVANNIDFIDSLLVDTLMPLGILAVLTVSYWLHSWVLNRQANEGLSEELKLQNKSKAVKVLATYVKVFLIYSGIILPYVSVQIFKTFSCQDIDPDDVTEGTDVYLRADYSVSCDSSRYDFAVAWASCAIVVYIIVLPMSYLLLLYRARSEIVRFQAASMNENKRVVLVSDKIQHVYFLFRKYRAEYWYWEVLDLYFRISITGFLVLIRPGSFLQIEVGFLLVFIYAKLFQYCNPYLDDKFQALKVVTLWQLFFIFHVAFLLNVDNLNMEENKVSGILFGLTFAGLFFDFMVFFLQCLAERYTFIRHLVKLLPSFLFSASQNARNANNSVTKSSCVDNKQEEKRCSENDSKYMEMEMESTKKETEGVPGAVISPFYVSSGE